MDNYKAIKDRFKEEGQSEYQVNIALYTNELIQKKALELNELADKLANEVPELLKPHAMTRLNRQTHKDIIYQAKYIRGEFRNLITMTKGHFRFMNDQDPRVWTIVNRGMLLCNTELSQLGIKDLVKCVNDYLELLFIKGIIKITMSYNRDIPGSRLFK